MRRIAGFVVLLVLGMAVLWSGYRTVHPVVIPSPSSSPSPQPTHLLQTFEDGEQLWYLPDVPALTIFEKEHPDLACSLTFLGDQAGYRMHCRKVVPAQDVTIP